MYQLNYPLEFFFTLQRENKHFLSKHGLKLFLVYMICLKFSIITFIIFILLVLTYCKNSKITHILYCFICIRTVKHNAYIYLLFVILLFYTGMGDVQVEDLRDWRRRFLPCIPTQSWGATWDQNVIYKLWHAFVKRKISF